MGMMGRDALEKTNICHRGGTYTGWKLAGQYRVASGEEKTAVSQYDGAVEPDGFCCGANEY